MDLYALTDYSRVTETLFEIRKWESKRIAERGKHSTLVILRLVDSFFCGSDGCDSPELAFRDWGDRADLVLMSINGGGTIVQPTGSVLPVIRQERLDKQLLAILEGPVAVYRYETGCRCYLASIPAAASPMAKGSDKALGPEDRRDSGP